MVMMNGGGDMMVVGSNPPTHRSYTPGPDSSHVHNKTYNIDSGRLDSFFNGDSRMGANSRPTTTKYGIRNQNNINSTISSTRTTEVDWPKPKWGSNEKALEKATRFNVNRYEQTQPDSSTYANEARPGMQMSMKSRAATPLKSKSHERPSSATTNRSRPFSAQKPTFKASYVDELLFGKKIGNSESPAPWNIEKSTNGHAFDYTDYKDGQTSSTKPRKSTSKTQVPRHSRSYVDESLFGAKPVDPGWEAPWSAPERKNIQIFDEFQHKVTIQHNDVQVLRPKSSVYLRKQRPQSSGKPVWR